MNAPFHKARYHDSGEPIPAGQLRREHRLATLSLIGTAIAVVLMVAHHFGLGLDERPRIQWERL